MSREVAVPDEIDRALRAGAHLSVSISGGKDSQAMARVLAQEHRRRPEWGGSVGLVHADLGRMEWHQTPEVVEGQAEALGLPLVVVRRTKGDLLQRWRARRDQLEGSGKPFWSSAAARYCTSDLKRDPIDKHLRRCGERVVCALGIRGEESRARARKPVWKPRKRIVCQSRDAWTWHPLLAWTEAEVWAELGVELEALEARRRLYAEGQAAEALEGWWPRHPAYVLGNERLSCSLCILASRGDLVNGAVHNPEAFEALTRMERETGFSFQPDLSLESLRSEVEERREGRARRLPVVA